MSYRFLLLVTLLTLMQSVHGVNKLYDSYMQIGDNHSDNGNMEKAHQNYLEAYKIATTKEQKKKVLGSLAVTSLHLEDLHKSEEYIRELLQLFPNNVWAKQFAEQHNLNISEECNRTESYIPKGWCQPTTSDYKGDWLAFRKRVPIPFHTSGWFNGDKKRDEAWILFDSSWQRWAIFIFLKENGDKYEMIKLRETTFTNLSPQFINISIAPPGEHETACGKGYWECAEGEPAKVVLQENGLIISPYESGGASLVYRKDGHFKEVSLND